MLILPGLAVFFAVPGPAPSSALHQITGAGHLVYFGLLARWLASLPFLSRRPLPSQVFLVMVTTLAAGGAIELLQPWFGRSASWHDLGIDLLGGLTAMVFLAPARHRLPNRLLTGGRASALLLIVLLFSGPVADFWDVGRAGRQFPVLGDFETRLEARRWSRGEIDRRLARRGEACLRVELAGERYAGTTLLRSIGNWQGYSFFCLSVYNPDQEPLRITVSIRDQEHYRRGGRYDDRFNRSFQISHGWNDLRIPVREIETAPAGRTLDLARLGEVVIFTVAPPKPRVIFLDYIHLVP